MLVDSDTASLDAFPTNVVVYDKPRSYAGSGGSTVTEVLVLEHGERFDEGAHDPLDAALRGLAAPIPEDADAETLEALRLQLIEGEHEALVRSLPTRDGSRRRRLAGSDWA